MDEERADLGRPVVADRRNAGQSQATALGRQQLLADLIGGDPAAARHLAATLIAAFGSVGRVLSAPSTALARFIEDPQLVTRLAAARTLVVDGLSEQLRRAPFDILDRRVQQWVVSLFQGRRTERVHFALLGREKQLLWDGIVSHGGARNVGLNLRKIVSRAIDVGASAVVLMHNHPSGDPKPSAADIDETRRIASLLKQLDIILHDHLIVAANTIFSMRSANLM